MNKKARANMIRSMDIIARCINSESIFNTWLSIGVADGDVSENKEVPDIYLDDDTFSEIMQVFLKVMYRAKENGGLYCDRIVNKR